MTQLGNQPEPGNDDRRVAEQVLKSVTQDLKSLQQGIIGQLSQEVTRLQAEKARLMADIEKLQAYQAALQSRQLETLSQQQLAQQQLWAKQLAQVLASHLQALMVQRINQLAQTQQTTGQPPSSLPSANGHSDNAHRLLASLDTTFNTTFKSLQRELNSYQSSLSQQLGRMQNLEQQGEVILETLINRLREELQTTATQLPPTAPFTPAPYVQGLTQESRTEPLVPPPETGYSAYTSTPTYSSNHGGNGHSQTRPVSPPTPVAAPIPLEAPGAPLPLPKPAVPKEPSQIQIGLILVLVSTVALSIHNVVVRIIGRESSILGLFQMGGFIQLSPGNSLLILWLRMLVVLPLMVPVAMFLYPPVWRDIKKFLNAPDRRALFNVVGSGVFLFLSQILIYIAIGGIGAGPAVTILFMYPLITVPLAWFLFGDRPTPLRWVVMAIISLGVIMTALPNLDFGKIATGGAGGVLTAVFAGVAFAFYLIFMQLGFKKLHPIPVSLIQFTTIFFLSSVILILPLNLGVKVDKPAGFVISGIILGGLTLIGYLTNNFGVRFMGAAQASIVASSGPVVTALLAFLIIGSPLKFEQILGILLVTFGVTALSFERMRKTVPVPKPAR